jgi:hypothetical protein
VKEFELAWVSPGFRFARVQIVCVCSVWCGGYGVCLRFRHSWPAHPLLLPSPPKPLIVVMHTTIARLPPRPETHTHRLPEIPGPASNDIQFASGLAMVGGGELLVSYGVADCYPALARFERFAAHLGPMMRQPGSFLAPPLALPPSQQEVQVGMAVRWEGPVREYSSFSTVAQELGIK